MKKINIIKKSYDIDNIIKSGKKIGNKYYYIYIKNNENNIHHRFAICVSKKLGNAVVRNKNKRQIKDIIDKSNLIFSNKRDYVIILKKEINSIDFQKKKQYLIELLKGEER